MDKNDFKYDPDYAYFGTPTYDCYEDDGVFYSKMPDIAPITEKVCTVPGPEFGDDAGKLALIVIALYGFRSDGGAFRNHLAECMKHLGWNTCGADRDLWMKAETRPDDGVLYWDYILI
jgi:hypothetical protein